MVDDQGDGRVAFAFTVAGVIAALGCFAVLWRMPMYSSSQTLAEVNGDYVLVLAAIPFAVALIVWLGLYLTCSRGLRAGQVVAGIAVGALGVLAFLGMFTIGMFIVPTAACLCVAVVMTPRPRRAP